MPETRFLITCYPRTGSNYLCGLLGSHPEILCHHEVFNPTNISYSFGYRDGRLAHLGDVRTRDADPFAYLERVWNEDLGNKAVGVKILWGQGEEVLPTLLADPSIKKIVLERENCLEAYVSYQRAMATGHFAHKAYDDVRINVRYGDFMQWAYDYRAWYRSVRRELEGQEFLDLTYEQVVAAGKIPGILSFLGVDPEPEGMAPKNKKQSSGGLREAVTNFDELEVAFEGTVFYEQLGAGNRG